MRPNIYSPAQGLIVASSDPQTSLHLCTLFRKDLFVFNLELEGGTTVRLHGQKDTEKDKDKDLKELRLNPRHRNS